VIKDLLQAGEIHSNLRSGILALSSCDGSRLERTDEIDRGMSCVRRKFRLRFAPLNPEYEVKINSRNC
jgi:hypothetical protein